MVGPFRTATAPLKSLIEREMQRCATGLVQKSSAPAFKEQTLLPHARGSTRT